MKKSLEIYNKIREGGALYDTLTDENEKKRLSDTLDKLSYIYKKEIENEKENTEHSNPSQPTKPSKQKSLCGLNIGRISKEIGDALNPLSDSILGKVYVEKFLGPHKETLSFSFIKVNSWDSLNNRYECDVMNADSTLTQLSSCKMYITKNEHTFCDTENIKYHKLNEEEYDIFVNSYNHYIQAVNLLEKFKNEKH